MFNDLSNSPKSMKTISSLDKITIHLFSNWLSNNLLHLQYGMQAQRGMGGCTESLANATYTDSLGKPLTTGKNLIAQP